MVLLCPTHEIPQVHPLFRTLIIPAIPLVLVRQETIMFHGVSGPFPEPDAQTFGLACYTGGFAHVVRFRFPLGAAVRG